MSIILRPHQEKAVHEMKNGCILCGGVGSGKSRTALTYYFKLNGGMLGPRKVEKDMIGENYIYQDVSPMVNPQDLYIITTARKRDIFEWEDEMIPFLLSKNPEVSFYKNKIVVDSWNNVKKYTDVTDAFFIFDEDRVVGNGVWVKSFLEICKSNSWVLLSATPGDTWLDYIPVFIANGFFRNRTEFYRNHVVFNRFVKYQKVDRYINTGRLIRLRNNILVDMDFDKQTVSHHEDIFVDYDVASYKTMMRTRWNPWKNEPYQSAGDLCYGLRHVVNSDQSRVVKIMEIWEKHPKLIIFYNFDYELEILKNLVWGDGEFEIAEWNGHKHQEIPDCERWLYLVQYTAGAEGWNCIKTNAIIFFSQNYSYKVMVQAAGRIDRLNTPYTDLYYYHLKSRSSIDIAIGRALNAKKKFNEGRFIKW